MIHFIKKNSGGPRGKGIVLPAPKPIDAPTLHAKKLVKKALNGESLHCKKGSGPKITKFDIGN